MLVILPVILTVLILPEVFSRQQSFFSSKAFSAFLKKEVTT